MQRTALQTQLHALQASCTVPVVRLGSSRCTKFTQSKVLDRPRVVNAEYQKLLMLVTRNGLSSKVNGQNGQTCI